MATTSTPISAQSIGTGSNKGTRLFPQQLTLQSTTTALAVEAQITNGSTAPSPAVKQEVRIRYAVSTFNKSAADAPEAFENYAAYLDVTVPPKAGQIRNRQSLFTPAPGLYLYLWAEVPALAAASTLDVKVRELP